RPNPTQKARLGPARAESAQSLPTKQCLVGEVSLAFSDLLPGYHARHDFLQPYIVRGQQLRPFLGRLGRHKSLAICRVSRIDHDAELVSVFYLDATLVEVVNNLLWRPVAPETVHDVSQAGCADQLFLTEPHRISPYPDFHNHHRVRSTIQWLSKSTSSTTRF